MKRILFPDDWVRLTDKRKNQLENKITELEIRIEQDRKDIDTMNRIITANQNREAVKMYWDHMSIEERKWLGGTAYHDKYGYTDDVVFDYGERSKLNGNHIPGISFEGVSNLNFIDLNPWWQGTLLSMFGHVNEYEVMKWIDNT
jgi:hypothetical protein